MAITSHDVARLAGLGHRDVAIISGPQDTSTGWDRELGFRLGLAERIDHPDLAPRRALFTPELVRRGTHAKPAEEDQCTT